MESRVYIGSPMHSCFEVWEKFHTVTSICALNSSSRSRPLKECFWPQVGCGVADSTGVVNERLRLKWWDYFLIQNGSDLHIICVWTDPFNDTRKFLKSRKMHRTLHATFRHDEINRNKSSSPERTQSDDGVGSGEWHLVRGLDHSAGGIWF